MFDVITGRRSFARVLGGMAGVVVVGGGATAAVAAVRKSNEEEERKFRTLPWPYAKLEPDRVAGRAFDAYAKGKCMYGSFEALVGPVAERLGGAYRNFPFDVMTYGAEGIKGWGTVCGALNGAAAAFQMLSPEPGALVDSLFGWYEQQPLPNMQHASAQFPLVQTISGSTLCHVSIARWCESTGKKSDDPARVERCGALVASVARRSSELLNAQLAGRPSSAAAATRRAVQSRTPAPRWTATAVTSTCRRRNTPRPDTRRSRRHGDRGGRLTSGGAPALLLSPPEVNIEARRALRDDVSLHAG
jgi:hypothetical protein